MSNLKNKLPLIIAGTLILYLLSTGISYAMFHYLASPSQVTSNVSAPVADGSKKSGFKVDVSAPKTEICPINGALYTPAERQIWEVRRPLSVMIENHQDSRPQSGLSSADVVYEAVAEGGITRFLAVFYCSAAAQDITVGPVRSARTYFLDFASEYGDWPLYAHVGGANTPGPADALGQIADYGWLAHRNDMNQFSIGFPTYWRDYERLGHEVATEHTMYSTVDKLWDTAQKRGLGATDEAGNKWNSNFVSWLFKDEASLDQRGNTTQINLGFIGDYDEYKVDWQYDKNTNLYKRSNGGQAHLDLNDNSQITAKNVIILYLTEKGPIDELKHMLYVTTGKGNAVIFQDGQAISGTWQKSKRITRIKFVDSKGKEIALNRGPIWIEVVAAGKAVTY